MSQTLKELLKPPFNKKDDEVRDNEHLLIAIHIASEQNNKKTHNEIRSYIFEKLEKGYERDFAEPMRWIYQPTNISPLHCNLCPACKKIEIKVTPYCPNCGQELDKPEGK